jgi:uncharacterized glyoxalase superfamily protein PhnB
MSDTAVVQPNIFPVLCFYDAPAAVAWLVRAFGFEKLVVVLERRHRTRRASAPTGSRNAGLDQAGPTPPIETTHYGARAYSAHDLEGRVWTFSTYLPQL